jgi:hypothetical protein
MSSARVSSSVGIWTEQALRVAPRLERAQTLERIVPHGFYEPLVAILEFEKAAASCRPCQNERPGRTDRQGLARWQVSLARAE